MSEKNIEKQNKKQPAACSNPAKKILTACLIVTTIVVAAGMWIIFPMLIEGASSSAEIKIPKNANAQMVSDSISKYFGDSYANKIMRFVKIQNIDLKARYGAYYIPKGTSAFKGMLILCRRGQTPEKFTINHQRSLDAIAERAAMKINCSPAEFRKAATDSTFLASLGLTQSDILALFLDQTYEIYWTATPQELLKKITDNYKIFWDEARREKAASLGLSPGEVTVIASIADEETNKKNEKGTIGRLYINRLKKGMKLQSDPTVRFALNDFTIKRVTTGHLSYDSPYNTYRYNGLPPGPICTTSETTIDAILDSEPSEYIYMCAREDFSGYHEFAVDYATHVQNALRYQHELDRRGIH